VAQSRLGCGPADAPPLVRALHGTFASAARAGAELHVAHFSFAGRPVRLAMLGPRLAERTQRAFAHLRRGPDADPDQALTIELWDETETGVACPPAMELDRHWVACGGALTASPDGRFVSFRYQDSITVLDRVGQHMVGCRGGSYLSTGEYSKPLLLLLSIWYHDRGVQLLHAGLIASGGAGVVLPGASGTGKSTTSLASLAQGLDYLSDDFTGIERAGDGTFLGHSIYGTACLARDNFVRFPELRTHAVDEGLPEEDKPILFLSEIYPDRLRASVPIRAIVLLRRGNDVTAVHRARRGEALRAFAESTLHTVVPRPGREALAMISALIESVPAWWLLLGPDLGDIAPGMDEVLSRSAHLDVHRVAGQDGG
jgi:hypothetical protein